MRRVEGEQQRRPDQQRERAHRGGQRRAHHRRQEQGDRRDAQHRQEGVGERETGALRQLRRGQRGPGERGGHRRRRALVAEQQDAEDVRRRRDHEQRDQHEAHHREQLRHEQPGPTDRADQHVAQRALLGLAGDRLARRDRDGCGQEQRQDDRDRRERVEGAVGEHRREERRSGAGPRTDLGDREQHRHQRRQQVDDADRHPGPPAAQHLPQLDADHDRATRSEPASVASRTTSSRERRSGASISTRTPSRTRRAFSAAASA